VPGVAAGEALRSWLFWGLAIAFFLDVIAINGTLTHIVPLLTDRGISRQVATAALSGTGFALIFGRVLSGWCLDRVWGPYVAIAFFVLPMIGIAILISGAGGSAPFLGRRPASRSLQARGLRRITLVVPESCANGLLQGARELFISDFRQMWAIHEILGLPRVTYQS
jgi:hypothetical protein